MRQADFAVTQKDLDFSHMRDHMRRILGGQSRLFSLGADNAVVQLVSRGGPRVLESQVTHAPALHWRALGDARKQCMGVQRLQDVPA